MNGANPSEMIQTKKVLILPIYLSKWKPKKLLQLDFWIEIIEKKTRPLYSSWFSHNSKKKTLFFLASLLLPIFEGIIHIIKCNNGSLSFVSPIASGINAFTLSLAAHWNKIIHPTKCRQKNFFSAFKCMTAFFGKKNCFIDYGKT